ncbi:hypothetical protein [Salipiger sp.]
MTFRSRILFMAGLLALAASLGLLPGPATETGAQGDTSRPAGVLAGL